MGFLLDALLISTPLLFGYLLTHGLQAPFPTFHDTDEALYHYPTILEFSRSLPAVDLTAYRSATTPLYHLLLAIPTRALGLDLQGLRTVNLVLSYVALGLVYAFTRKSFGKRRDALLFTLVFGLTPYFFGRSLRLFTENLALAFALAGFLAYRWMVGGVAAKWIASPLAFVGAVLTRQSLLWFPFACAADPVTGSPPRRPGFRDLLVVGVPVLALLPLVVLWGGLVPPAFREVNAALQPNLRGICFAPVVLGFYSLLLAPRHLASWLRSTSPLRIAAVLVSSILLVGLVQLAPHTGDDGFLWRVARSLPDFVGGNLLFYVLLPVGVVMALDALGRPGALPYLYFPLFSLSFSFSNKCFQNYYDSFVLLFLFDRLGAAGRKIGGTELLGAGALGLLSIGYILARF